MIPSVERIVEMLQNDEISAKQAISLLYQHIDDEIDWRPITELRDAAIFVFAQLSEIAQSDGPPLIQEWSRIDRLGVALKAVS